ncbi:MAG: Tetratricopeptide 2 repeat protein [Bacteroidetes bacterium]|jgi:hypothetical protein|nr:Tetratricopeptide 2 repeat protein [Bacteroidota bacterium]
MKKDFKPRNIRNLKLVFYFSMILILGYAPVIAQVTALYPNLEMGQYDVGYKTIIDFDYSRTYNLKYPDDTSSQNRDPRPIIINIWYPAKVNPKDKPMLYGDYIKVQTPDATLKTFIKRIEDYNEKNSSFYIFDADSLNKEQKEKFTEHLQQPLKVFKNASPLAEKFPLVIYHAGLGGTLNDNTVLCEYLASHGFVVISGAFQASNYESVNLNWDLERSTKDIDFMVNAIKSLPFIDFSKIAAIGQSYGAQAILGYKTEDYSPVSCLISLDNTFDYSIDVNPQGFESLTQKLFEKIQNMNVPTLLFAGPAASFKVMDSLRYSDRVYATIEMEHNDYISLSSFAILKGLQNRRDKEAIWNKYVLINQYCLNFLRGNFFNDTIAKNFILSKHPYLIDVHEIPKGKAILKANQNKTGNDTMHKVRRRKNK